MQAADEPFAHLVMNLSGVADAAAIVDGEADVIGIQGRLLLVVVAHDVVRDGPLELAGFHELAIAFVDGRAIAVGTGNESHIFGTDTVAQEARKTVSGNEDASHMTEMKRLVAVRHARRYHSASRPLHIAESLSHCPATPFLPIRKCNYLQFFVLFGRHRGNPHARTSRVGSLFRWLRNTAPWSHRNLHTLQAPPPYRRHLPACRFRRPSPSSAP